MRMQTIENFPADVGKDDNRAWYLLTLLSLAFILSMLDRTVISLLVEPIKADLQLTDTGIALLQGATFAIFYALTGVPIGWLADRMNRRNIVGSGIGLWSAMTIACGFANSYAVLFAARTGVAVGEAALNPAAYSMLTDRFSKAKLGRAIGIFTAAGVMGTGLALLIGGKVYSYFLAAGGWDLGWMLKPWQATFVAVGLPGIALAALVFATIAEPTRQAGGVANDLSAPQGFWAFLSSRRAVYWPLFLGYGILCMIGYAFVSWAPASLGRVHGMQPSDIGAQFGLIMLVFGSLGPVLGGLWCDRLIKRGRNDGPIVGMLGASLFALLFSAMLFIPAGLGATLFAYCGIALGFTAMLAAMQIAVQLLTPPEFRARAAALGLVFGNVIGLGLGPLLVGLLNDHVFTSAGGIAMSLPIILVLSAAAGFVVTYPARKAALHGSELASPAL
jgi:MFS family permease